MDDYIRKAVGLADGWSSFEDSVVGEQLDHCESGNFGLDEQVAIDALAAQLVRQVDALDDYFIFEASDISYVCKGFCHPSEKYIANSEHGSTDRTMNTIKAIVDSGVLSTGNPSNDADQAALDAENLFEEFDKGFEGPLIVPGSDETTGGNGK